MDEVVLPGAAPLGGLPAQLEAKVVARIRAGYPPQSADHPRRGTWRRVVVPGAALGVLDAVGAVIAYASGHAVLGSIALVLFVLLVLITLGGVRAVREDPLRLTTAEREAVSLACGWRATHSDDAAVRAGAAAAGRVVACAAWWSPLLDSHRARLDLQRWLDGLDTSAAEHPASAQERADALTAYASGLEQMVARHAQGAQVSTVPDELDRLCTTALGSDRLSP